MVLMLVERRRWRVIQWLMAVLVMVSVMVIMAWLSVSVMMVRRQRGDWPMSVQSHTARNARYSAITSDQCHSVSLTACNTSQHLPKHVNREFLTIIECWRVQVKLQPDTHHVTADVIKDVRAKLRPLVGGHVDDVTQVDMLERDKVNARASRLDRRQLRR